VLPTTDQSLPRELTAASQALLTMPNYAALYTLDRDYDILQLEGRYVDFHPRIRHPYPGQRLVVRELCELDPLVVRGREVERLIDTLDERGKAQLHAISLRPRVMTRYFLEMYEEAVESLDERIKAETRQLRDRSLSREAKNEIRDWIDWARGELRRLEPYVTALQAYRDRLGEIEERLRTRVEMEGP
jgi:hypothetical protein